jgi:hypothetical protein
MNSFVEGMEELLPDILAIIPEWLLAVIIIACVIIALILI